MNNNTMNGKLILGIDHGYGNCKTAHTIFRTGVKCYDEEPIFNSNVLEYGGRFYSIGEVHKEFIPEKIADEDYYILTLAAIAKEMNGRNIQKADIHIAAGLPLKWVKTQRNNFREYLMKEKEVSFKFNRKNYSIHICGVDIFPQGYSAVAERLKEFQGVNMLVDIGNGTMNVMYINDRKPIESKCWTEKYGTNQCMIEIKNAVLNKLGSTIDESTVERVLRNGTADITENYLDVIRETGKGYVEEIFRKLREYEYNPNLMRLYIVGGGSCLIKNFGKYDAEQTVIISDIHATAKGYEYLTSQNFKRRH